MDEFLGALTQFFSLRTEHTLARSLARPLDRSPVWTGGRDDQRVFVHHSRTEVMMSLRRARKPLNRVSSVEVAADIHVWIAEKRRHVDDQITSVAAVKELIIPVVTV